MPRIWGLEVTRPNAVYHIANSIHFRRSFSRPKGLKKVGLTLVSMLRNEDPYVLDWLRFHSAIGVDRFVLYLNEDDADCIERVAQLAHRDAEVRQKMELIHWPDVHGPVAALLRPHGHPRRARPTVQELAFRHFFRSFGDLTEYVLKIDVDEFVYRTDFESSGPRILDLLRFRGTYPIRGYNFGSSGEELYRPGPVPCRFVRREKEKTWVKSIAHVGTVHEHGFAHHFHGPQCVDDLPLAINHYRIKSREEYVRNKVHISGYMAGKYAEENFDELDLGHNAVADDAACRVYRRMLDTGESDPRLL